jgi:hypothetical protein
VAEAALLLVYLKVVMEQFIKDLTVALTPITQPMVEVEVGVLEQAGQTLLEAPRVETVELGNSLALLELLLKELAVVELVVTQ